MRKVLFEALQQQAPRRSYLYMIIQQKLNRMGRDSPQEEKKDVDVVNSVRRLETKFIASFS